MIILAVDTTTPAGSTALLKDSRILAEVNLDSPVTFSERLLLSIDLMLKAQHISIKEVDGYAVASGPGSFTGIRIGLSTIKALAHASSKPVAAVSSLEALAVKAKQRTGALVCPLIDAKKGEVYAALFETKSRSLKEIIPQGAYKPDKLFSSFPAHRIIHFIGNGREVFRGKIIAYFKDKARFPSRSFFIAEEVGFLGYQLLKSGKGKVHQEILPLYLRKSQAEEKNTRTGSSS